MGVILRITDGKILIFSIRGRSVALKLTICNIFVKISGWNVLLFLKIDNFTVQLTKFFNDEIFLNFEFWLNTSQVVVSRSMKKISG